MDNKNNNSMQYAVAAVVIVIAVLALYFLLSYSSKTTSQFQAYNHTSGNLTVVISQSTGSSWSVAYFLFVPAGTQYSNGVPLVNWNASVLLPNVFASGSSVSVTLPVSGPVAIGTHVSGTVWSKYQFNVGGTFYYLKVGTVNTTAI